MSGIRIGEKHTEDNWGLIWTDLILSAPEAKTVKVEIAGADGIVDLTEALGGVKFHERKAEFDFVLQDRNIETWHKITNEIMNYIHGKRLQIILDTEPEFYYEGRFSVDSQKSDAVHSVIAIVGSVDPYKYEVADSLGDWMWDDFNFETGIVREYNDLQVEGELTVIIPGLRKHVIPVITASAAMTVSYQSKSYELVAGVNKIYDLALAEGENILTFTGSGAVNIEYRGGSL